MNARRHRHTRSALIAIVVIVGLLAVAAYAYVRSLTPQLELGVGYAARVACGCRFIEHRPLAQCPADFEAGMEPIRLREDVAANSVTAYVPLIASRTVRFDPLLGCQPDAFTGAARTIAR